MTINIIYWSGTGNTQKMAELIQKGVSSQGAEVVLKEVGSATPDDVSNCDILALGCPSMGDEVLEESEFEPYMNSIESLISGKKIALFGSYGWGDGQWMRDWQERVINAGAQMVEEGFIINEEPGGDDEKKCEDFGVKLVSH